MKVLKNETTERRINFVHIVMRNNLNESTGNLLISCRIMNYVEIVCTIPKYVNLYILFKYIYESISILIFSCTFSKINNY